MNNLSDQPLSRPQFFDLSPAFPLLKAGMPFRAIMKQMKGGTTYVAEGTYGTVLAYYSWLKKQINNQFPIVDFLSARKNKDQLSAYSNHLLIRIVDGNADLEGAPKNEWLKILYPDKPTFLLRFTDFLGMNGAWQWYENGIRYPGLDVSIHPFYGVYFPTRYEHLLLFDDWLSSNNTFEDVVEIGIGCGVLTYYLLKHKAEKVSATDISVNALQSVYADLKRHNLSEKVSLFPGPFFQNLNMETVDLVVFNPPWIPEESENNLDRATHYNEDFFTIFFEEATKAMKPGTKLVLIFSNFAEVAGLTQLHPIRQELEQSRFKLISFKQQPLLQKPSQRKNWLAAIRQKEMNELWVLEKN